MIGQQIFNYTLKKHIGSGGMANVYYAENSLLGGIAAIKVLKKKFDDSINKKRFVQEARLMKRLNHPNIRKVYNIGAINGQPAMIMEYLSGGTLRDKIQNKPLSKTQARYYLEQCVAALAYTHQQGIVHRDIKPANIFVTKDNQVKILDFGIAKSHENVQQTLTGQTLGTVLYMSPEQVRDPKRVNTPSDVYSLGVTFYHLLSGQKPYAARNSASDFNVQLKIISVPLDLSTLPPDWQSVLATCLKKEASDRVTLKKFDFNRLAQEKHTLYESEDTIPFGQPNPKPTPQPKPAKTRPIGLGAVALMLLLLGVIGYVASLMNQSKPNNKTTENTITPKTPTSENTTPDNTTNITTTSKLSNNNMVRIEGGTFDMGCTKEQGSDCDDDEKPAHTVTLPSFYMSKYEVTQAQWQAIMGNNPSLFSDCPQCPVENVSWNDVQDFLKQLNAETKENYRLPTEAEWEYAARGGKKSQRYKYSESNDLDDVAWYTRNSDRKTHEVGQKKPNELELYDMSGNIWEWCQDTWHNNYKSAPSNGSASEFGDSSSRVLRGGSWDSSPNGCRVSFRLNSNPDNRSSRFGFRLAHSL